MAGIAATAGIGAVTALHHHGKTAASSVTTNEGGGLSAAPDATAGPDAGEPGTNPNLSLPALGAPATAAPGKVQAPVVKPRVRASTKAHASSGGS
jgi:hypothetical protein